MGFSSFDVASWFTIVTPHPWSLSRKGRGEAKEKAVSQLMIELKLGAVDQCPE